MASVFKRGGKRAKGYWYASWFDHHGKRRTRSARTTDKATAERIARKLEAEAALEELAKAGCGEWHDAPPGPKGGRPSSVFRLSTASTSTQPAKTRD
jgi:hypothetical protein